jgi:hypothetical protein
MKKWMYFQSVFVISRVVSKILASTGATGFASGFAGRVEEARGGLSSGGEAGEGGSGAKLGAEGGSNLKAVLLSKMNKFNIATRQNHVLLILTDADWYRILDFQF